MDYNEIEIENAQIRARLDAIAQSPRVELFRRAYEIGLLERGRMHDRETLLTALELVKEAQA